ncbi:MAG TPA: hypothetical protein VML91_14420 [Burkholderiales bacterium]|nr:hypothetical protein [Burkholderiales bacterium]
MRRVWLVAAGVLAVTFFAQAATARCVRDVAPSGAISVRCSDGVRGYLPSDDAPPPSANSSSRPSSDWSRNPRNDNYTAPTTGSSSSYTYKSPDTGSRANDSAAGALSRGRTTGQNDRPAY